MSDLREALKCEFQDIDYRYAYAKSFLNTRIATQIKTLREQRGKKQAELATAIGTKQSGFSRFEDVNHSVWKTDTLWKIARALDVRLNISFETFGSLIDDKEHFDRKSLQRPDFKEDLEFKEVVKAPEPEEVSAIAQWRAATADGTTAQQQMTGMRGPAIATGELRDVPTIEVVPPKEQIPEITLPRAEDLGGAPTKVVPIDLKRKSLKCKVAANPTELRKHA